MSLIPFILDLADELHEFSRCLASGIDINDFGFGLYTGTNDQQQQQPTSPQQQQQQQQSSSQQQSPRRSRTSSFSSAFWMPTKRHHPYNRIKSACCGKPLGDEGGAVTIGVGITAGAAAGGEKDVSPSGTPGKAASYSVVNKNGFQVSMNVKQFSPNELSVKTIDNCIVVEGRHDDKEDGHGVISRHFVRKYMLPKGYDPKDVLSTLSSDGILTVKAPPPPPPIAKNDERTERVVEIQPAPGPAQTVPVVVSAKEVPLKEQTKKLLSPTARAESQLPEKRQKLDLPQEQEQEQETTETQTPPSSPAPPQPPSSSESSVAEAAAPAVDAAAADNDDENEKAEEQTAENDNKQAQEKPDSAAVTATPADDVEGDDGKEEDAKQEVADQADGDKQLKQNEAMETDETDKTTGDKLPETNGDTNAASTDNSNEANEPVAESCTTSATKKTTDDEVPAENAKEKEDVKGKETETDCKVDNDSKMEVDEVEETVSANKTETADADKTPKSKAVVDKEEKGENNAIENTNNNTNSNSTTQNDKGKKDKEDKEDDDNNSTAGKVPADSAKSAATTKAAESVADGADIDIETAVLPPEAKNDIDDVALLKAAVTADATEITAAEENALLSEPMDGITTSDSPTVVETVECSLFSKSKSHLGNGNSATLVAAEEVAN